jgi:hypothetical protein
MAELEILILQSRLPTEEPCMPAISQNQSSLNADPFVRAVGELPPDLRSKVLSRAWADVASVVNHYHEATGLAQRIDPSDNCDHDWTKLNHAVKDLAPDENKEKAVAAFYEAVITVLQAEKKRTL